MGLAGWMQKYEEYVRALVTDEYYEIKYPLRISWRERQEKWEVIKAVYADIDDVGLCYRAYCNWMQYFRDDAKHRAFLKECCFKGDSL